MNALQESVVQWNCLVVCASVKGIRNRIKFSVMVIAYWPYQCATFVSTVSTLNLELIRTLIPKQMETISAAYGSWKSQPFVDCQRFVNFFLRGWRVHPCTVQTTCKQTVETVEKKSRSLLVHVGAIVNRMEIGSGSKQSEHDQYFDLYWRNGPAKCILAMAIFFIFRKQIAMEHCFNNVVE